MRCSSSCLVLCVVVLSLLSVSLSEARSPKPAAAAAPVITPFYSWTATLNTTFLQAGYPYQYSTGVQAWQLDDKFNRSSWFGNQGQDFVADYAQQTIYVIDYYRQCQFFCSMATYAGDACNAGTIDGSGLCDYDLINRSQFVGQSVIDGQTVNEFTYSDPLEGMDMADHTLWITTGESPIVLQSFSDFHPFGTWQANVTTQYIDFVAGTPPASVFEFSNEQYCYQGNDAQCIHWQAKARDMQRRVPFWNIRAEIARKMNGHFNKQL